MPNRPPVNVAELLMERHLKDAKIAFVREHHYALPRKLRADFWIMGTDLLIEIQGGVYSKQAHGSITGILADNERLNEATKHHYRMLRFTPDQVADGTAIEFVKALL